MNGNKGIFGGESVEWGDDAGRAREKFVTGWESRGALG